LEDAQRRWNEILEVCREKNRSVHALLRAGRLLGADDSEILVLGFPYEFHRERIEDLKNRAVVEDVIARVLNHRIRIRCALISREAVATVDPLQAAMEDPIVRSAISLGARVRSVTDDSSEEKQ
jgi:DNA polymerase-3 subunit gamma/tau